MLAEFLELVQIHCATRQEREVADVLIQRLRQLGLEVMEDGVGELIGGNCGNLIATLPGKKQQAPRLLLTAHLDCVGPCLQIKPRVQDGRIVSDGTTVLGADDKAGVAAIMETLRVLQEQAIDHGGIQVVFTVAEEGGLNGSKNIDKALLQADYGYALDSSGRPGKIINQAPGQNKIKVKIHGRTAHAGIAPEEGINAIVVAGKALSQVRDGRIDEETTANIGIIQGGRATNIVPELVEITCETRSRNMTKLQQLTDEICATFEQVAVAAGGRAELEVSKAYDPFVLAEDAAVIAVAAKAAGNIGLLPVVEGTGGGSDANFFNSYGIPCAVLGVGMEKVHTTEEFILEEDLYKAAELLVEIVKSSANQQ